jgi:hypothetical protein
METENSSGALPNLNDLRKVVEDAFNATGYLRCSIPSSPSGIVVDSVYAGNGMVWAVVFVSSVNKLEAEWSDSNPRIRQVAELLARIAEPEAKWNFVLLAVLMSDITENDIPIVTRFQEEPSYFSRFVISVGGNDPLESVQNNVAFLLLDWIGTGASQIRQLQSAGDEITTLANTVGIEFGISRLENTRRELLSDRGKPDSLAAAIVTDMKGTQGR